MPGAVLYIRRESNQALAPVYRDRDGTDPYPSGTVVADENGYAYFYATDGLYRIQSLEPAIDWRDVLVGQLYGAVQRYETYADMAAALPQPEGTLAQVYADPDEELRGFYDLVDGAWVYSDPQPLTDEDVQTVIEARNTATAAASSASSSASTATAAASDASDSAALAEAWATKTDGPVAGGEFSAKHYAEQAQTNAGLPVYQSIPTSDVGPIYAVGIGPMEWDDDSEEYVPIAGAPDVVRYVEEADIPSTDEGPIYVIGVGAMEWDAGLSAYAVRGELATRLTALDDSVDFAIVYPNGGSESSPANVSTNTRYMVTNPFPGYRVFCLAEIQSGGAWGATGWYYATTSRGVSAYQYNDGSIAVQTGSQFLMGPAVEGGGAHGNASAISGPAPCRVKVWKVKGAI